MPESPFIDEELFERKSATEMEPRTSALLLESPFGALEHTEQERYERPASEWSAEPSGEELGQTSGDTEDALDTEYGDGDLELRDGDLIDEQLEDRSELSSAVADAIRVRDWPLALKLAIQEGARDESELTNLIFFARHPGLPTQKLDPNHPDFQRLSREWVNIRDRDVWPVIQASAENTDLVVSGKDVAAGHRQFRGSEGKRFKTLIEEAAIAVDINPGLQSANVIAETGTRQDYLTSAKVSSYRIGVDDFYDRRTALKKRVPAYSRIAWDKGQTPEVHLNDAKVPREVKTIKFDSGPDALLASAVYLKYGEVRLREEAARLGGDFGDLPLETRWALIRMAFNAGVGGATKRLARALKGQDVLVRKNIRLKAYQTERNATVRTAQAMHLSDWIFGIPTKATPQPERFAREPAPGLEMRAPAPIGEASFPKPLALAEGAMTWEDDATGTLSNEVREDDSDELDAEPEWEAHLLRETEESEEVEEELVEDGEWAGAEDFSVEEAEAYNARTPADLEESLEEAYDENELPDVEGETGKEKALTRMKFEFQTKNRIWRNDGNSSSPLGRKYGPSDFLIDKKGVRLESETRGVLEFETEWFRTWPKLAEAIEKAVEMTEDINKASPSKFDTTRKAFPFDVAHLRKGSAKEKRQGFWDKRRGMEGAKERILGATEELEVEVIDPKWDAGIQSSESFLLDYYESFLRQHEWPLFRDGAIKHAKAILDAANAGTIPVTQLVKLRSFLQVIVNYIMRGQGGKASKDAGAFADVKGMPAKQAFTLMSRTSFASMYRSLLTGKEKKLFQKIVKTDVILNEMGLNHQSPVFTKGYGSERHEAGPTVYEWLSGIPRGVDLLSARSGKGLSAAMGRYDVETGRGKKDRWLVKFEARNTMIGAWSEAKDWAEYVSKLFELASKRERHAVDLAYQQGIVDENKLANLVFHARHPELGGRPIRKVERDHARVWLRIRNDLVRPFLEESESPEEAFEGSDERDRTKESRALAYPAAKPRALEVTALDGQSLEGALGEGAEYEDDEAPFELESAKPAAECALAAQRIDAGHAARQNRVHAKDKGWGERVSELEALLGFVTKPNEKEFAKAVARWQCVKGTDPVDGILGHNTWAMMQTALDVDDLPADEKEKLLGSVSQILGEINRKLRASDQDALAGRRQRLRESFGLVPVKYAMRMYDRLEVRRTKDSLSRLFYQRLARATRRQMVAILGRRFFTAYDLFFNPIDSDKYSIQNNPHLTAQEKADRKQDVNDMTGNVEISPGPLWKRLFERQDAALEGKVPVSLTTVPGSLVPAVRRLSDAQIELFRLWFPNGKGGIHFGSFQHVFEQFANGELRNPRVIGHRGHNEPNGSAFFLFAEFAFLCVELGISVATWTRALQTFVKTQEIMMHVYREDPPLTPPAVVEPPPGPGSELRDLLPDIDGRGFGDGNFKQIGSSVDRGNGQSGPQRKMALRLKYDRMDVDDLKEAVRDNLLRALRMK